REGFALEIDKATEARAQAAAYAHGVPVAEVIFVLEPEDGLGEGYAMQLLEGEPSPRRFLGDEGIRASLAQQVGAVLARIHEVPRSALPPLPHETPAEQLRRLRDAYDSFEQPSPVFEVAFRWLEVNLPPSRPAALVH